MKVEKLQDNFAGKGEMSGCQFDKIFSNEKWYIYKVNGGFNPHYEVFIKKLSPVCIDFEKREYSETHFRESYPKGIHFGKTAWCCRSFGEALKYIK